jgi:hypothetical protein
MKLLPSIIILLLFCIVASCSQNKVSNQLDLAESLMDERPDSAMFILNELKIDELNKQHRARYALLMSMALDKNYIDTTSFAVLQPAIDYYLKNGNPNEKLRTYYYQGRIFQNKGDNDNALNSFIKSINSSSNATDSLCIARALIAESCLFYEFYDFKSYVNNYLRAASIYNAKHLYDDEFDCLLHAFDGTIILENSARADSLYSICNQHKCKDKKLQQTLHCCNLSYISTFGTAEDISKYINNVKIDKNSSSTEVIKLAFAYHKLNDNEHAMHLLDSITENDIQFDTLIYQSVAVPILESLGQYKEALSMYEEFNLKLDSISQWFFDQKSKSIADRHALELKAQKDARHKTLIIWGCSVGIAILSMSILILFLLIRNSKAKHELNVERIKSKDSENAKLKIEKENLALENKNLQLERDLKISEAKNLSNRIDELNDESDSLKALISSSEVLPKEVHDTIRIRIEVLNSLLASHISDNTQYEHTYDIWVKELTENSEKFMNSNRLALLASHPKFIKYFEDHGLTKEEINYVCLYAIGLRGKEVGNYINKRSHVNTSSAIRKKLGIDKHETNIGIYVRKLLKSL